MVTNEVPTGDLRQMLDSIDANRIERELKAHDEQFGKMKAKYQQHRKKLLALAKAVGVTVKPAGGNGKLSTLVIVEEYLRQHPSSRAKEIAAGTGLEYGIVYRCLKANPDRFELDEEKQWNLGK